MLWLNSCSNILLSSHDNQGNSDGMIYHNYCTNEIKLKVVTIAYLLYFWFEKYFMTKLIHSYVAYSGIATIPFRVWTTRKSRYKRTIHFYHNPALLLHVLLWNWTWQGDYLSQDNDHSTLPIQRGKWNKYKYKTSDVYLKLNFFEGFMTFIFSYFFSKYC